MSIASHQAHRWMVGKDGVVHGMMNIRNPSFPVTPYVQGMMTVLALHPTAQSLLSLGLGCGSTERYIAQAFPGINITTVEVSQARVEQVMSYFPFPEKVSLVTGDALDYVADCTDAFDIIFCDIFGSLENPGQNQSEKFYEHCSQRLTPCGLFALNFVSSEYGPLVDILVKVRKYFETTGLLEVPEHSNVIIFGLSGDRPDKNSSETAMTKDQSSQFDIHARLDQIHWLPSPV